MPRSHEFSNASKPTYGLTVADILGAQPMDTNFRSM